MTEKRKAEPDDTRRTGLLSKFHLEADRTARGMSMFISGVIGVSEFSGEKIELLSHTGRIFIEGARLSLSVYENGTVEIRGKVLAVRFGYGKN